MTPPKTDYVVNPTTTYKNFWSASVLGKKLNLGCGNIRLPGRDWHHVDINPSNAADQVFDIEHGTWPLPSEHFSAVLASHVLEHLAHLEHVMREIWRVLEFGGILEVYVPYGFNKAFNHLRWFWKGGPREIGNVRTEPNSQLLPWLLKLNEISKRSLPYQWHLQRYLHWNPNVGFKRELHFVLEKIPEEQFRLMWKWSR